MAVVEATHFEGGRVNLTGRHPQPHQNGGQEQEYYIWCCKTNTNGPTPAGIEPRMVGYSQTDRKQEHPLMRLQPSNPYHQQPALQQSKIKNFPISFKQQQPPPPPLLFPITPILSFSLTPTHPSLVALWTLMPTDISNLNPILMKVREQQKTPFQSLFLENKRSIERNKKESHSTDLDMSHFFNERLNSQCGIQIQRTRTRNRSDEFRSETEVQDHALGVVEEAGG
jgi:hypothetical protein